MDSMNVREASDFLRVSASTLQYWRANGQGPAWFKMGRKVFYDRAELVDFVGRSKAAAR